MIKNPKYDRKCTKLTVCEKRPLELYYFLNPLGDICFELNPIIKKLQLEYGHYFTITYVLLDPSYLQNGRKNRCKIKSINAIDLDLFEEDDKNISASLAIKAAELQGRKAGIRFLRKLQQYHFLRNKNIQELETLISCAEESEIDIEVFKQDLFSKTAKKALQCDFKICHEMNVTQIPTVVIFNNTNLEEEGIKIEGINPYEAYVDILSELLNKVPVSHNLPSLLTFIQFHEFVRANDIAIIYGWERYKVEKELKKLQLLNEIEKIQTKTGDVWRAIKN